MDMNRLTQKSQEALQEAQTIAARLDQTEVDGEHLLLALIDQPEGLVPRLLDRADVDTRGLRTAVTESLARRPSGWPRFWTPPNRRPSGSRTSTSPSSTSSSPSWTRDRGPPRDGC